MEDLREREAIYRDLAFIERELGIDLPILGTIEYEDKLAIGTVAGTLESGEGTATMEQANTVVAAHDIARAAEIFAEQAPTERDVTYTIFGRPVTLGPASYDLPPVKLVDVRPLGDRPDAPARVVFAPEGDGQMTFHLHRGPAMTTRHPSGPPNRAGGR